MIFYQLASRFHETYARRVFQKNSKKEAVHLFKEQGLIVAEVNRKLDIAPKYTYGLSRAVSLM